MRYNEFKPEVGQEYWRIDSIEDETVSCHLNDGTEDSIRQIKVGILIGNSFKRRAECVRDLKKKKKAIRVYKSIMGVA